MDGKLLERLFETSEQEVQSAGMIIPRNPILYVKTRTITSGSLTELECYPVYSWDYRRRLTKVHPTPEAVRIVNTRNSRKKFERLAECNFKPGRDHFLTLTYANAAPEDEETCRRDLRNYLKRVNRARKKAGMDKAKCIGVIETGKSGRLHHHLLIEGGLSRDEMEQLWGHGYANCDRIQQDRHGLTALTKYMTKCFEGKRESGRHRYFYTRNLRQPKVTESKSRISRRQAERIREDADVQGEIILRKMYPGKMIEELTIRQTDWLPGAYIYARMRS